MEKSIFLEQEGDNPKNKIWDFLIVHSEYDYSMKDIARFSEVSYTALKSLWKEFKQKKIVVQTREVGKAKMYKLNFQNLIVVKFIDFYWAVIDSVVSKDNNIDVKEDHGEESYSCANIPVSARHI